MIKEDGFPRASWLVSVYAEEVKQYVPLSRADLIVVRREYLPRMFELAVAGGESNYCDRAAVYSLRQFCWEYGLEKYGVYFTY
ncbi:hypothetical protein HOD05_04585 [Candidatus Woesearchaeota archaeon]|jgi:hypothetical protein|nr:hypothetical protein [Candidatus Woesearchaeota archaeon]MBT4150432.1 hypothetical protein [Candidatus Woesearchaeota archaeon]MBT4247493.1 hypothetical protein [Candidatus Woesearchaeota archaeon]MBT4434468.1 hypothetical protein [Candidatus Woesearchaeota archaeon]MBT7331678.1 hypothetical protein [Candidatus Woesearchaeota archaeon]